MQSSKTRATFAGGCFWCIESAFATFPGVVSVKSGYMGPGDKKPSYDEVSNQRSGFYEAVQITYDPKLVTYTQLLDQFWRQIDPTDPDGQFADRGAQYKTAIFYHNSEQKNLAISSKKALDESGKFSVPVVTEIVPTLTFFEAPDYHQEYAKKHPLRYNFYAVASGRKPFIEKTWTEV